MKPKGKYIIGARYEEAKGEKMRCESLSWSFGGGGNVKKPKWEDVQKCLEYLNNQSGTITLEGVDSFNSDRSMQVRFEEGRFFLTLGYEADEDWLVIAHKNHLKSTEMVPLLGDCWRVDSIFNDADLVRKYFAEFFQSGYEGRGSLQV